MLFTNTYSFLSYLLSLINLSSVNRLKNCNPDARSMTSKGI